MAAVSMHIADIKRRNMFNGGSGGYFQEEYLFFKKKGRLSERVAAQ